jgi:hypothetical protein
MTFGGEFTTPLVATWAGVAGLVVIVAFRILTDRTATRSATQVLQDQINALRREHAAETREHALAMAALEAKVDIVNGELTEQRSLKHRMATDLAKSRLALDIVRRLQRECSCGALNPLAEILDNLAAHGDI